MQTTLQQRSTDELSSVSLHSNHQEIRWGSVPDLRSPHPSSNSDNNVSTYEIPEDQQESQDVPTAHIEKEPGAVEQLLKKFTSSRRLILVVLVVIGLGIYALVHDPNSTTQPSSTNTEDDQLTPIFTPKDSANKLTTAPKFAGVMKNKNHPANHKTETKPSMMPNIPKLPNSKVLINHTQKPSAAKTFTKETPVPSQNLTVKQEPLYPTTSIETQIYNLPPEIARKIGLPHQNANQQHNQAKQNSSQNRTNHQGFSSNPSPANGSPVASFDQQTGNQQAVPGTAQFQGGLIINNPHLRVTNEPTRSNIHPSIRR